MSAADADRKRPSHAIVWRVGDGATSCGKLELGDDALILSGASAPRGLRISFDDVTSVSIGRRPGERIDGLTSLVIERRSGDRLRAYVIGSVAALTELRELISACVQAVGG